MSAWNRSAAIALAFGAFACSRGSAPATKGADTPATPPPVAISQPAAVIAPPQPEPSPTDASTAERWAALGVESPAAPVTTMAAGEPAFPMPPPVDSSEPTPAPTPEGPSETQALQEKIERYRAEYGAAKEKVQSLERQVAELTDLSTKVYGSGSSASTTTNAGVVRARLDRARGDLESAREALAAVEDRARRDGVGYGQLY